jgi:hypothetical protein
MSTAVLEVANAMVEPKMSREEAFARCSADCYVEFYGDRWLIVPLAPVEQPAFFVCTPGSSARN